ncbi:MAG: hypothetical protein KatS3mg068_0511 [Candidatus Sericytochromatia bacterium]|nr:MAG: hypothetical protein KatS3mg068_0511 [Candidatus Sericytochromatia bacterium]
MKKYIFKIFVISYLLVSCSINPASGQWENINIDKENNRVTTIINIVQTDNSFTGKVTTKKEKDNKIIEESQIDISGYVSGNILVIENVSQINSSKLKKSTLTLSSDKKSLTLSPGSIVFNKK